MTRAEPSLYLGLISGTSVDGIDAALVSFEPAPQLHAARTHPYPEDLRKRLLELAQGDGSTTLDEIGALLTVHDSAGGSVVNVNDAGDPKPNVGTLTQTTLTGLDMPGISEQQSLFVQAASGSYVLTLPDTYSLPVTVPPSP